MRRPVSYKVQHLSVYKLPCVGGSSYRSIVYDYVLAHTLVLQYMTFNFNTMKTAIDLNKLIFEKFPDTE